MKGGYRELALFAGAGGGLLGSHLVGFDTVCAVEYDPYRRKVLIQRQAGGFLLSFPIWDDDSEVFDADNNIGELVVKSWFAEKVGMM